MGAEYTPAQAKASAKYKQGKAVVTIYLSDEQRERWKVKASEEGLSVNQWITKVVEDHIKESC